MSNSGNCGLSDIRNLTERSVAPFFVITIHTLIAFDIVYHAPRMQQVCLRNMVCWCIVATTLFFYFRTSLVNPGFLRCDRFRERDNARCRRIWSLLESDGRTADPSGIEMTIVGKPQDLEDPQSAPDGSEPTQSGIRLRFCEICNVHQPLRTKHCRDCNRCVRTHDHHCPWIGTCVGERNRMFFLCFLLSQFIELLWFFCEGVKVFLDTEVITAQTSLIFLCVAMFFLIIFLVMVLCLLCFHTYLALVNMTTWEHISWHKISYLKSLAPHEGSPFSTSIASNVASYCFPASVFPLPHEIARGIPPPPCRRAPLRHIASVVVSAFLSAACRVCGGGRLLEVLPPMDPDGAVVWGYGEPHTPYLLSNECYECC